MYIFELFMKMMIYYIITPFYMHTDIVDKINYIVTIL